MAIKILDAHTAELKTIRPRQRVFVVNQSGSYVAQLHKTSWLAYGGPANWEPKKVWESGHRIDEDLAIELFPFLASIGLPYRPSSRFLSPG